MLRQKQTSMATVTVIVRIRHPRYTAVCRRVADALVRGLPAHIRYAVYWRLLAVVRAAPRFVVLSDGEAREP